MVDQDQIELIRENLRLLLRDGDYVRVVELLAEAHPADQADLLEGMEADVQSRIVRTMGSEQLAEVVEYLDEDLRAELLAGLPPERIAPVLNYLDEDVAADVVQSLEPEQAEEIIQRLEYREDVQELLDYPEDTAGGRMSVDFVALDRTWTVDEAIQFLRSESPDDTHPFYLYIVGDDGRLIGTVSLRSLVTAAPETPIAAITREEVLSVDVTADQEVAAERMRHYNLLAIPVVDSDYRLRGVITADDILDVQVEEATEDIYRLAGLPEEERIFRPLREAVPPRLGWLMLNLTTALAAAAVVSLFEGTIERVAVLAVFLPMVGAMAGNAGLQTLTLVVRSIALGEIEARDGYRVLRHEASIAAVNGLVIGGSVGVVAWLWQGSAWLGLIVGVALLLNIANAMIGGVIVPLTLRKLKVDPALASGVIVTFADLVGFLVFLGLGAVFVSRLD